MNRSPIITFSPRLDLPLHRPDLDENDHEVSETPLIKPNTSNQPIHPFSPKPQQSLGIRILKHEIITDYPTKPSQDNCVDLSNNDQQKPLLDTSTEYNMENEPENCHTCSNCQCY